MQCSLLFLAMVQPRELRSLELKNLQQLLLADLEIATCIIWTASTKNQGRVAVHGVGASSSHSAAARSCTCVDRVDGGIAAHDGRNAAPDATVTADSTDRRIAIGSEHGIVALTGPTWLSLRHYIV